MVKGWLGVAAAGSAHQARGFYHDGRFATLRDVVDHYDAHLGLALADAEKTALVEYLKSL